MTIYTVDVVGLGPVTSFIKLESAKEYIIKLLIEEYNLKLELIKSTIDSACGKDRLISELELLTKRLAQANGKDGLPYIDDVAYVYKSELEN